MDREQSDREQSTQRNNFRDARPSQDREPDATIRSGETAPRSAVIGTPQSGSPGETADGLTGSEEALRRAAEGETRPKDLKDLPVFDRAEAEPKI